MEKAGVSRSGIPRPDLGEALRLLSGGAIDVNLDSKPFAHTVKRLKGSAFCGYELVFYAVHFHKDPFNYAVMSLWNVLCSESVWQGFLTFKAAARTRCRYRMEIHSNVLREATMHRTLADVLLDHTYEAGPVSRVEMALKRARLPDFDAGPVLQKYGCRAGELLMALPEFAEYVPNIMASLETNRDVARFLFPGCQ